MENIRVCILSGYARAGKTTLMNELRRRPNWVVFSSSEVLHTFVSNIICSLGGHDEDEQLLSRLMKEDPSARVSLSLSMAGSNIALPETTFSQEVCPRDLYIKVAEEWLVRTFGRQVFPLALASLVANHAKRDGVTFMLETIGGEEYELLRRDLCFHGITRPLNFNLRAESEEPDADSRKLIPNAVNVNRHKRTPKELAKWIERCVSHHFD